MNLLSKILKSLATILYKLSNKIEPHKTLVTVPTESLQAIRVKPWFNDNGDKTHRLDYELNKDSVVFDLGGYEGEWAVQIYCLYGSSIYIFEPYEKYFENIKSRFRYNKKIKLFQFGLSGINQTSKLGIADNSSSVFLKAEHSVDIHLASANDFFIEQGIDKIDLMKINIEGGEYDLLDHLIETGNVNKIVNI